MILKEAGLDILESSLYQNESSLTGSEVAGIHRAAHRAAIRSIPKVEIGLAKNNRAIIWKSYLDRIKALNDLSGESEGILGLKVVAPLASKITIEQYLRVVAVTRIACKRISNIISPSMTLPAMVLSGEVLGSRLKDEGNETIAPARVKTAILPLLCGANDLGNIGPRDLLFMKQDITSAGLEPGLRDCRFVQKLEGTLSAHCTDHIYEV